jgi:glyoxylase-like metal-dependent hydrolase (beta-lactamase superfamily II)
MGGIFGEQITPHLYRVAWRGMAGPGVMDCDVYAIDCGARVALIDSGRGGASFSFLKANLQHWDLWDRLSVCLLTHLHSDHAGGATHLQAEGIQVWGSEVAAAYCSNERARFRTFSGEPLNQIVRLDRVLRDSDCFSIGDQIFEVLATPGHTSTCLSYFLTIDSLRCAFTGDLVMPNGGIGFSGSFDFNPDRLRSSLVRVLGRNFDALLTGHTLCFNQPEGFWLKNGSIHVVETLQSGLKGKWMAPIR